MVMEGEWENGKWKEGSRGVWLFLRIRVTGGRHDTDFDTDYGGTKIPPGNRYAMNRYRHTSKTTPRPVLLLAPFVTPVAQHQPYSAADFHQIHPHGM